MAQLEVRIWDVGHGLSVWLRMPNGRNHWIDAGFNPDPHFSPSQYVKRAAKGDCSVDFLIISHTDKDHFDDLHNLIEAIGKPRAFLRNSSVPPEEKYGSRIFDYQKSFFELDSNYNRTLSFEESPQNPLLNGGVEIVTSCLDWSEVNNINDSSIVAIYQYADTAIVFPGDIEQCGWEKLQAKSASIFLPLLRKSRWRILVAPHHGRGSGYTQSMMDFIQPSLIIISDEYGREPTDRRFREAASGIPIDGVLQKFISTKTNGRAMILVDEVKGLVHVD